VSEHTKSNWRTAIDAAALRIAPYVRCTPVIALEPGTLVDAGHITLKLESLQHSGSFKARGAFNNLLCEDVPAAGVIAASGGNHGAAVAYAAKTLGHSAEIFVPTIAAAQKLARLEQYGAATYQLGDNYAQTLAACEARQRQTGAIAIHAYDSPNTVAGQGTIAREFEQQADGIDTLLVAVGGGGLISGVAGWFEHRAKVIAVETYGTATLANALEAGQPVATQVCGLAADALGARVLGSYAFDIASRHVNASLLVSDDDVREAQRFLWRELRLVAEPAGATALAALLCGVYTPDPHERVGIIICGANTDPSSVSG
jgi:threonine dehydratase